MTKTRKRARMSTQISASRLRLDTSGKTLPTENEVQQVMKLWWDEAILHGEEEAVDPERNNFLRPSALPFCPLKVGYTRITDGVETERHRSFNENFYTEIGHAVHELLQNFVGRLTVENGTEIPVKVYGHWKCPDCKKFRMFSTYKRCSCGGKPKYVEIEIKWRTTVGHIDKVIRIGNLLFILDYKTTGSFAIRTHRQRKANGGSYFPYKSNRAQITRYTGLFEHVFSEQFEEGGKFHGCTVVGALLVYVSRESVREREFVYLPASPGRKKAQFAKAVYDDKMFKLMLKAVSRGSKKIFLRLIEEKPCQTPADYDKYFQDNFNECPLKDVCFSPSLLKNTVFKALKTYNEDA